MSDLWVPKGVPISRYLDDAGNGAGSKNANGDYSLAAEEFFISPSDETYLITSLVALVGGTGTLTADKYGVIAALTNGVQIKTVSDLAQVVTNWTDGVPIKSNKHLYAKCYDAKQVTFSSGDEHVVARWSFMGSGGPVVLHSGYKLVVELNDDFSSLAEHTFLATGIQLGGVVASIPTPP